MAITMPSVVAPPTPRVRRRGTLLVDVLNDLPELQEATLEGVPRRSVSQRWRLGVKFMAYPRGHWTIYPEDPCVDVLKADAREFPDEVDVAAFTAYKALTCSTLNTDFDEFRTLLAADSSIRVSDLLASQLMDATATLNVPDAAQEYVSGEHSPARSVGLIDDILDFELGGAQGVVLMDPQTAATAAGSITDYDGDGNYYTRSGHRVVIHAQFRTKATADGGGALGDDDGMVYGAGPLFGTVTSAEFFDDGAGQILDIRENVGEVRAEVFGLIGFDPDTVFWQRVTLPA